MPIGGYHLLPPGRLPLSYFSVSPRFRPPKWRERNAARELFHLEMSDVEIARRVGVSPRSIGRWRRAWLDGSDPFKHASSFGAIAEQLERRRG